MSINMKGLLKEQQSNYRGKIKLETARLFLFFFLTRFLGLPL